MSPPRLFDLGFALALTVVGLAEVLVPFNSRQGDGSELIACLGVAVRGLALTQRRTRPLAAALVVLASLPLVAWAGGGYVLFYGQAVMIEVALYAVARYAPMRQAVVGVACGAILLLGRGPDCSRAPGRQRDRLPLVGHGLGRGRRVQPEAPGPAGT